MKTLNRFGEISNHNIIMVLLIIAVLQMGLTSCGKNTSRESADSEIAPPTPPQPVEPAFAEVDEMPVFTGGDAEIIKFIRENTNYPAEAKKNNITGRVVVKFVVEKDCTVSEVQVLNSVDPLLDAEAIRVVSSLPKFEKPAKKNGEIVRVNYMLPITFALQ